MVDSQRRYRLPAVLIVGAVVVIAVVGVILTLRWYRGAEIDEGAAPPEQSESAVKPAPPELEPLDDSRPEPELVPGTEPDPEPGTEPESEPPSGPYPPPRP